MTCYACGLRTELFELTYITTDKVRGQSYPMCSDCCRGEIARMVGLGFTDILMEDHDA